MSPDYYHPIIPFPPTHSHQARVTRFPKMFHLAAINYMDDWDRDARVEVAKAVLVSAEDLKLPSLVFQVGGRR